MDFDPEDGVFVLPLPTPTPRRRTRRHVVVAESDWTEVEAKGPFGRHLRTAINLNGVWLELVLTEVSQAEEERDDGSVIIRVRGKRYEVTLKSGLSDRPGSRGHGTQ